MTRREFARYLVAGAGALALGNVGLAAWTQLRTINEGEPRAIVDASSVEVGGTHLFRYPTDADPAVLLRVSDTEVVAFSQKCTHLGCVVYFEAAEQRWHCPCHEGNFEAETGAVRCVELRSGATRGAAMLGAAQRRGSRDHRSLRPKRPSSRAVFDEWQR